MNNAIIEHCGAPSNVSLTVCMRFRREVRPEAKLDPVLIITTNSGLIPVWTVGFLSGILGLAHGEIDAIGGIKTPSRIRLKTVP